MTTPKQGTRTIETPFGPAIIHDHRGHEDSKTVAAIQMDGVTVNKKLYHSITLYVTNDERFGVSVNPHEYRSLTPAASDKLEKWFKDSGELATYLEPLDPADVRKSLKHSIAYPILSAISKQASNQYFPSDKGRETDALIDEILEDILKARAIGTHYSNIKES